MLPNRVVSLTGRSIVTMAVSSRVFLAPSLGSAAQLNSTGSLPGVNSPAVSGRDTVSPFVYTATPVYLASQSLQHRVLFSLFFSV